MRIRGVDVLLLTGLALCASVLRAETPDAVQRIVVGAGRTHLIDTAVNIERVSVASPAVAEAVPVSARTLMINGRAPGETSLVLWLDDGTRSEYEISVKVGETRLEAAKQQADLEFGGSVHFAVDNGTVYLTGSVKNLFESQRAVAIAETLGRVVNLLKVEVPPQEIQILLKVRFADVDRSKSTDLGVNFVGVPAGFPIAAGTGAYGGGTVTAGNAAPTVSLSDSLNLLFWDPHINVGATLKDLESRAVLQILAEPNLLALNGHEASFVAGGEFPYPTLQGGGSGIGQVTIQFQEFGIRLRFTPTITPRGTIRLHLTPEVSSLDYADALTVSGFTIPALDTRRVTTDIELKDGQTFAIAGLLDRQTTESLSRMPGLADIPVLGKLFTTRSTSTSHTELIVIVTPELVAPISDPRNVPNLEMPLKFLEGKGVMDDAPRTAGPDKTEPVPVKPKRDEIPVQEMEKFERDQLNLGGGSGGAVMPGSSNFGGAGGGAGGGGGMTGGTVTVAPAAAAGQNAAGAGTNAGANGIGEPPVTGGK
ncbi:MAG: pilus assembly protein N-terminal domain-containing protein [Bryobacteraceae bacterium]|jgi:pilus assembly protein CpaC